MLVARGGIAFTAKVTIAQEQGALATVVYNNDREMLPMGGDGDGICIPSMMITKAQGEAVRAAIATASVTIHPPGKSLAVACCGLVFVLLSCTKIQVSCTDS